MNSKYGFIIWMNYLFKFDVLFHSIRRKGKNMIVILDHVLKRNTSYTEPVTVDLGKSFVLNMCHYKLDTRTQLFKIIELIMNFRSAGGKQIFEMSNDQQKTLLGRIRYSVQFLFTVFHQIIFLFLFKSTFFIMLLWFYHVILLSSLR